MLAVVCPLHPLRVVCPLLAKMLAVVCPLLGARRIARAAMRLAPRLTSLASAPHDVKLVRMRVLFVA